MGETVMADVIDIEGPRGARKVMVPQAVEAELAVLAGVLLDNTALARISSLLHPADFFHRGNSIVFETMGELARRGDPIDTVMLRERLLDHSALLRVGGDDYLLSLTNAVPTVANIEQHAALVAEKARERRLCESLSNARAAILASDPTGVAIELGKVRALADAAPGAAAKIALGPPDIRAICKAQPGKHLRIPTLCPPLDRYTGGGFQTGRFITIGGAPGVRKTSYALAMAHAMASAESPRTLCVFIAGDEPRDGLLSRVGQMAGMERRSLDDEDLANSVPSWDFVAEHMATIPNLVLFEPDSDDVTVEQVAAWAGEEARKTHARLVLIIDSLQTAPFTCDTNSEREKSTRQIINDRVKTLKRIKNRERACVIVISELNRDGYKTGQKADLSSFKESSDIEYGADVAMAIVGIKSEDSDDKNLVEVTLLKNRLGPNDVAFRLRRTSHCTFETEEAMEAELANTRTLRAEREAKEAADFDRRAKACAERLLGALARVKGSVNTRDDLGALVKEQKRVVVRAISTLLAEGRIEKPKNGSYRIVNSGPSALARAPHLSVVEGGASAAPDDTATPPPHTDADMPPEDEKVGGDDLEF